MRPIHPYAIVLGIGVGIAVLFTLRHPLFALLMGGASMLGLDIAMKSRLSDPDQDSDDTDDKDI